MIIADQEAGGDVLLVILANLEERHTVRLEFDRDYGTSKRTGWSVSIDGIVRCEFASGPLEALALALVDLDRSTQDHP